MARRELEATVQLVRRMSDEYARVTVRDWRGTHHTVFMQESWRLSVGDSVLIEIDEDGHAHVVDVLKAEA